MTIFMPNEPAFPPRPPRSPRPARRLACYPPFWTATVSSTLRPAHVRAMWWCTTTTAVTAYRPRLSHRRRPVSTATPAQRCPRRMLDLHAATAQAPSNYPESRSAVPCAFFAHSVSLTVMRSSLLRSLG